QSMLENARQPSPGLIATCLALGTLLIGATGVFAQLQESLNTIWGVETTPGVGIVQILKDRFISFVAVLGSGFLLLVSLVMSAGLAAVGELVEAILPAPEAILE